MDCSYTVPSDLMYTVSTVHTSSFPAAAVGELCDQVQTFRGREGSFSPFGVRRVAVPRVGRRDDVRLRSCGGR